jgi:hypothetical protein
MQLLRSAVYDFHPKTFILPVQINDFKNYMLSQQQTTAFIIKLDQGNQ